jgi:Family of unknown function (DUF6504)
MRRMDENVSVSINRTGEPVGFLWRNSTYRVRTKPIRWFARRDWWLEAARVQRGVGAGVLEVEVWRMVASKAEEPDQKTQFEILNTAASTDGEKAIWRLVKVYD